MLLQRAGSACCFSVPNRLGTIALLAKPVSNLILGDYFSKTFLVLFACLVNSYSID